MRHPSIRRRLLALLLGSLALVWTAMLALAYVDMREEVGELADAHLEQNARTLLLLDLHKLQLLADNGNAYHDGHGASHHFDDRDGDDDHAQHIDFQLWRRDGVLLMHGPGSPAAAFDPRDGYATQQLDGGTWRSFALHDPQTGYQVRVFEPIRMRAGLLHKLVRRMAQLLLPALTILALLIWIGIGRGLQPLTAMSRAIAARGADNLQPLALERIPAEAQPLVDSLNNLLSRLSQSIDRERSFTADAAHELRTPLAAIQVQAEVALAAQEEAQRTAAIRQVIAGVHRTTHLVQQLLLLARLDHADMATSRPVDLAAVATESAARYAGEAERRGIELEMATHGACLLAADPTALSVMIDNLLDNAIKYGREGGHVML
ncbi:MAG: histidine kinase dimerization/phospho-acceptor domain-containing protein, partial [Bacillota bacterium]